MRTLAAGHEPAFDAEGRVHAVDPGAPGVDDDLHPGAMRLTGVAIDDHVAFRRLERGVVEAATVGLHRLAVEDQFKCQPLREADLSFVIEPRADDTVIEVRHLLAQRARAQHPMRRHGAPGPAVEVIERQAEAGDEEAAVV